MGRQRIVPETAGLISTCISLTKKLILNSVKTVNPSQELFENRLNASAEELLVKEQPGF